MPIFIVEDDPDVSSSVRFMLENEGYPVATFDTGGELLAAMPEAEPCCVVIDYVLPDMNGVDVAKRLQSMGVQAPMIITTGHLSPAIRAKVQTAGLPLVEKPLAEDLLAAIKASE